MAKAAKRLFICLDNAGYEVSLERRKIYVAVPAEPVNSLPSGGRWFHLWSALCHQGDVYPASFAAVPHFVQTLADHIVCACFDFFLLPASIDLARHRRGVSVPAGLADDYRQ